MCVVLLSVRPTKRVQKKKIWIQREQTKSAGRFTTSHFHKPLYPVGYIITADMTTALIALVYHAIQLNQNFCRFRSQTFSWVQWSEVSIGDGIYQYLWIFSYTFVCMEKKRGMWSKGKISRVRLVPFHPFVRRRQ